MTYPKSNGYPNLTSKPSQSKTILPFPFFQFPVNIQNQPTASRLPYPRIRLNPFIWIKKLRRQPHRLPTNRDRNRMIASKMLKTALTSPFLTPKKRNSTPVSKIKWKPISKVKKPRVHCFFLLSLLTPNMIIIPLLPLIEIRKILAENQ